MKYDKTVFRALALITQFSINMLVPIFLCFFLGLFIDRKAGTSCWAILLFFVGAIAGFRNVYLFAKNGQGKGGSRHDRARKNRKD